VSCSSRKAPFRLREVTERFRQQGVVVTIGTGCSRRIYWNAFWFWSIWQIDICTSRAFCGLQLAHQSSFVIVKTLVTQLAWLSRVAHKSHGVQHGRFGVKESSTNTCTSIHKLLMVFNPSCFPGRSSQHGAWQFDVRTFAARWRPCVSWFQHMVDSDVCFHCTHGVPRSCDSTGPWRDASKLDGS